MSEPPRVRVKRRETPGTRGRHRERRETPVEPNERTRVLSDTENGQTWVKGFQALLGVRQVWLQGSCSAPCTSPFKLTH